MHTEAIRKYMTEKKVYYKLVSWDVDDEIYWLKKFDKDGNSIGLTIIYNIHELFDRIEGGDFNGYIC
jgi:hypothetical protein